MNEVLGYIILVSWVVCNGMAIGLYVSDAWEERPLAYRIAALPFEVAAVWLAIRMVTG